MPYTQARVAENDLEAPGCPRPIAEPAANAVFEVLSADWHRLGSRFKI